jgi:hypothetical protein
VNSGGWSCYSLGSLFLSWLDTYLDCVTLRLFVLKLVGHMFA